MKMERPLRRTYKTSRRSLVMRVAVALLVIALSIVFWQVRKSSSDDGDKVVFRSPQSKPIDAGSFMKLPENSSSTICKKITRNQIQGIIGEPIQEKMIPFPDVKTSEGTTAGCSYAVTQSNTQKLRAVSITARTIDDQAEAQKIYTRMIQDNGKAIAGLAGAAHYTEDSNQLHYLKDSTVVTITISKLDPEVEIDIGMLKSIAALL